MKINFSKLIIGLFLIFLLIFAARNFLVKFVFKPTPSGVDSGMSIKEIDKANRESKPVDEKKDLHQFFNKKIE